MGQKVHPIGFRLGYNKTWRSRWYAEKEYANLLHEDLALKKDLKKRFSHPGDPRVAEALLQVLLEGEVLVEEVRVLLLGVPATPPGLVVTQPEPDRMDFLTHLALPLRH